MPGKQAGTNPTADGSPTALRLEEWWGCEKALGDCGDACGCRCGWNTSGLERERGRGGRLISSPPASFISPSAPALW